MSTGTLSPIEASGDPSAIDTVMALPDKGAGLYYSLPSQGVSLQLAALGVMLALLGCDLVHIYNPAALGIMLPASLGVGGLAIFTGGMWNLRLGQTIAGTIGGLYGAFWFSFGLLLLTQAAPLTKAVGPAGFDHALSAYLIIWMVVSAFLMIGTWFVNRAVFAQQLVLVLVFLALGIGFADAPGGSGMLKLGGWLCLVDGFLALYIAMALVINETAGKPVLPIR